MRSMPWRNSSMLKALPNASRWIASTAHSQERIRRIRLVLDRPEAKHPAQVMNSIHAVPPAVAAFSIAPTFCMSGLR